MRDYEPYYTEDGSIGLYSYKDKDVFHSKFGALTEAWEKFILPANILKEDYKSLNVLDICYGIGYNTKALMSFCINKKILNNKKNNERNDANIETIHTNKDISKKNSLSTHIDTIDNDKNSINIDCLEINSELVKLSPLFKTTKTPDEMYSYLVPSFLDCFKFYYKLKHLFVNFLSVFQPKNKKRINELLDLKFKNMHIDREYKVHPFVNIILINKLTEYYDNSYPDKILLANMKKKKFFNFLDISLVNYAHFNHLFGYNNSSTHILSTFLHNIYYAYLSIRYRFTNFKSIERLFNINFHVNDARKTILGLKRQYDLIFLDAFTYTKAPQLWSQEFIAELYNKMAPNGVLMTYSTSAQVRNTLLLNKFYVGKILDKKTNRVIGTIASKNKSNIDYPLTNYDIGLCNTKAGIPYHDPQLRFTNEEIKELREYEFKNSNLLCSSKYLKMRNSNEENL